MDNIYYKKTIEYYDNFIKQIQVLFSDLIILNTSDDIKYDKLLKFTNSMNDEQFELFINSKIKLFSHKNPDTLNISEVLFNTIENLSLKKILNNQSSEIKQIIWTYLHTLFLLTELSKDSFNEDRVNQLKKLINIINILKKNYEPLIHKHINL